MRFFSKFLDLLLFTSLYLFVGVYSSASDMYAFAVLLNELLSEKVPFPDVTYGQIVHIVGTLRQRPTLFVVPAGDTIGRALIVEVARCWHQDPGLRPSFHELATELTHLLRKEVESSRIGDRAAPLTPPPLASRVVEGAIAELYGWLTSTCRVGESDAMSLAHVLVTVKDITSSTMLSQVLHRSPHFLSKEMQQSVVLEVRVCAALGIGAHVLPPTLINNQSSSVKLESLSCIQLCALLDHCDISEFKDFITNNNLRGNFATILRKKRTF